MDHYKWNKVAENNFPKEYQVVIAWNGKEFMICRYRKALTWKGYQMKFVNVMSKGFWDDTITHWTTFPNPPVE